MTAATFATAGTCTAADGLDLVVTEAAGLSAGYLIGGMIDYGGVVKQIANHVGADLTLKYPFKALEDAVAGGSVAVTVYPGCAKNFTTCKNKFNNLLNYGGAPWLPPKNVFRLSSII